MSRGGTHSRRSPVPLMVEERDQANRALFWDGDASKQSFIRVVGLSTPRAFQTRPRPSSAPARRVMKASGSISPRHDPSPATPLAVLENSCSEFGGEPTSWGSLHPRGGSGRSTNATGQGRDGVEKGRVRITEHRLRQLIRENACMRDAMLNKADEAKLERLAEAQRRNQELIAALETAKEGAERKTRKTEHRVRALQNQLRRKRSLQEPPAPTQQKDTSSSNRLFAENLANARRPHSAPRIPLQCTEAGTLKPSVTSAVSQEPGSSEECDVAAKPDEENDGGGDAEREAGSPRQHQSFVVARPQPDANGWRSPPKRPAKAATSNDRSFSTRLAADARRGSVADGPSNVRRTHVGTGEATHAGDVPTKETSNATRASQKERRGQQLVDNTTETAAVREDAGGNDGAGGRCDYDGRSGGRNIHRDAAPKMLLAREAEAAVRRAERAAAAREKEERELRLYSSFRAKELHATTGPDWATIKAHQDIVRKQRTRDRAAFLAATSSLPARMARHAAMQEVEADRAGWQRSSAGDGSSNRQEEELVATPTGIEDPQYTGRMMQRRQERWKRLLVAAKAASQAALTKPRTPPMEKRRLAQEAKRRAREKAERSAQKAAAEQRAEDEKLQFQKLIAMYRDSGNTFRETKASLRKAEETRLRIEQDLEQERQEQAAALAEEARQREVSRAVREYVAASEARRREEHGAGPPLEELIRRKKEEKEEEFRERRRLNRSGLRQALRKRPNLLERQEKFAQQHSRRLAAQASTARDFLEGREGFAAAGRRALRDAGGGWMAKAAADDTFTSNEKAELGLPELAVDVRSGGGSDTGEVETVADNRREPSVESGRTEPSVGGPGAPANGHDASSGEAAARERSLSSPGEEKAAEAAGTEVGGDDSQSGPNGDAERRGVETIGSATEKAASDVSADGSAYSGGTLGKGQEKKLDQDDSGTQLASRHTEENTRRAKLLTRD